MWSENVGDRRREGVAAREAAARRARETSLTARQPGRPHESHPEISGPGQGLETRILDHAVNDLRRRFPELSAASLGGAQSLASAVVIAAMLLALAYAAPGFVLMILLSLPFFFVVQIRLAALGMWLMRSHNRPAPPLVAEAELPHYSVLVPLYREAAAAPGLVAALARLDYPPDRLQILFITEADDEPTRRALERSIAATAPALDVTVLTVPEGLPRTKPRALNYALHFARGDVVAIFDAEDAPDPGQLRAAAAAFLSGGPELACVQAPLQIYNPDETALTRQFALEYAALFDAVLPALCRLGLPLPLGGTSNHFRRDILSRCGAWDPFNVTEDADLGFRLARLGYRVSLIEPATWEEAPPHFGSWFRQRTRWLKGWMQTYLVHMRAPAKLKDEFGSWRFFGFQAILAGMILSALVHPWFYLSLAAEGWARAGAAVPVHAGHPLQQAVWWLCLGNLALSYVVSIALSALALRRRGGRPRLTTLLALPLYWLAISAAAYRAVYELIVSPFHWAKTDHRGISCSARPAAAAASYSMAPAPMAADLRPSDPLNQDATAREFHAGLRGGV